MAEALIVVMIRVISRVDGYCVFWMLIALSIGVKCGESYYKMFLESKYKDKGTIYINKKSYRIISESEAIENDLLNLSIKSEKDTK